MKSFGIIFIAITALQVEAWAASQDRVDMKNGDVYRGTILEQKFNDYVQIRLSDGNEKRLQFSEIANIKKEDDERKSSRLPAADARTDSNASWQVQFYSGMIFSNSTGYELKNKAGTSLSTSSDTGQTALVMEASFNRKEDGSPFGIGAAVVWNNYNYTDKTPSDTHFQLLAVPKGYFGGGAIKGWIGLGAGLAITSIGRTSESKSGVTAKVDSSASSFAFSPRVGVDCPLGNGVILNAQISYFTTSASVGGTLTSGTSTASFSEDVNRTWWVLAVGVGYPI